MKLQFLGTELYFLATIYKHSAAYAMATFQAPRHNGIFLQTIYTSSGWNPLEWVNPPMDAGVEYRTTERYKGKPVYRKLIEYSNTDAIGSTTSVTTTNIPHDISNLDNVIRCDGKLGTYILPYLSLAGNITTVVGVTSTTIQLRISNTEWSNRNWAFDLAYTKTT